MHESVSLHSLPTELVLEIGNLLPTSLDCIALSHVCRTTYYAHSSAATLFWYNRRRNFPTEPAPGNLLYYGTGQARGVIAKDFEEKFNPNKDYRQLIIYALNRIPEPGVKNPPLRCQMCCIHRAYKVWDDFDKAICPICFEVWCVDRSTVSFIKGLDKSKLTVQTKR